MHDCAHVTIYVSDTIVPMRYNMRDATNATMCYNLLEWRGRYAVMVLSTGLYLVEHFDVSTESSARLMLMNEVSLIDTRWILFSFILVLYGSGRVCVQSIFIHCVNLYFIVSYSLRLWMMRRAGWWHDRLRSVRGDF